MCNLLNGVRVWGQCNERCFYETIGGLCFSDCLTDYVLQGRKVDGSVNAHAVNVSMKRKYRLVLQ